MASSSSSKGEREAKIRKSKSTKFVCFPSCFGYSGDASDSVKKELPENSRSGKKRSLFSSSRFRIRQSSGTKTVPVDAAIDEQATRGRDLDTEIQAIEEDVIGKRRLCDRDRSRAKITTVDAVSDQSTTEKSRKTKCGSGKQQQPRSNTVGDNLKDHPVPVEQETCHKPALFCRKPGTRKTGSQPGSPLNKQIRSSSSTSLPQPDRPKPVKPAGVLRPAGRKSGRECCNAGNKFDSLIGMSVLLVILVVMLLGGRIWAIICTSTWFYFIPRLRTEKISGNMAGRESNSGFLDVDSDEYKKKVILKGLLERNHRNPVGVL